MGMLLRLSLVACILIAADAIASTTHYIAGNGSDSNTGASKSSPWLHAPGMRGCSSNCASYSPNPGDQFIFRGGDTWHYSTGSPIGLPWTWTWSGTSGNNVYLGVDETWYSGSSFARPILTMDNPISATLVSSCIYDDTALTGATVSASYVTLDDFEFTGKCWTGDPTGTRSTTLNIINATHSLITRNYFHGWSATSSAIDAHRTIYASLAYTPTYNEIDHNVIDGSDTFHGTTSGQCSGSVNGPPCQVGFGVYGGGYNFHHNILRYLSNGIIANDLVNVHDNVFEYMWNSYMQSPWTHPNVVESGTGNISGVPTYFYNNVIRHTRQNVTKWVMFDRQLYEFNNVYYDNFGGSIDCLEYQPDTTASTPVLYFYNNTLDASSVGNDPCLFSYNGGSPAWSGTANYRNNHIIGSGGTTIASMTYCQSGAVCTNNNDLGSETFQTESVANGQGYTSNNNYGPTAGGATIGAGANLTSSCATFSGDGSLCSGTSLGVLEQAGQGGYTAVSPGVSIVPRPSNGGWDSGAYQYDSGQSGPPSPPTGLTATVH